MTLGWCTSSTFLSSAVFLVLLTAASTGNVVQLTNLSISTFGTGYGSVMQITDSRVPLRVQDRCVIDATVPRLLQLNVSHPEYLFCGDVDEASGCSLTDIEKMIPVASVDSSWSLSNVTIRTEAPQGAPMHAELFAAVFGEATVTWFATVRYAKADIASSCMCIHSVYTVDPHGNIAPDGGRLAKALTSDADAAFPVRGAQAAAMLIAPCVFGVGLGTSRFGGVSAEDYVVYNPSEGMLTRFTTPQDLPSTSNAHVALRSAVYGDQIEYFVLRSVRNANASGALSLSDWPLVASDDLSAALLKLPASALLPLWHSDVVFCNSRISDIRKISNGVLLSSGVTVAYDFSLTDTYAILPLELAKSIAIRSSIVVDATCSLACAVPVGTTLRSVSAPCQYACEVVNATLLESRFNNTPLSALTAPLFLVVAAGSTDEWASSPAIQLNLSFFLRSASSGGALVLSIPTWYPYSGERTPSVLLGGAFAIKFLNGDASKVVVADRIRGRVGVYPPVHSVVLDSTRRPSYEVMCDPAPTCSDGQVYIAEINACVSTTCADFLFMEVNPNTGVCSLRSGLVFATGVLFVFAAVGEVVLARLSIVTSRRLKSALQLKQQ